MDDDSNELLPGQMLYTHTERDNPRRQTDGLALYKGAKIAHPDQLLTPSRCIGRLPPSIFIFCHSRLVPASRFSLFNVNLRLCLVP